MAGDDAGSDPTRLLALSDGVFAIAITLLVVNVDLSTAPDTTAITGEMLVREGRDAVSYVVSFLVIGNFWTDYRRVFGYVTRHTRGVTWLNILFLMSIAFLPFPTSLLGEYGGSVPVAFYAASMTVTGLFLYWIWRYVSHNELLVSGVDSRRVRFDRLQFLLTPIAFGLSVPVALFVAADLAFVCWASLFALIPLVKRYFGVEDTP